MFKNTIFSLVDETTDEVFISRINSDFEKTAGIDSILEPELMAFIKNLKPKKGMSYLLINAMGSSDYFSSNLNADWFSEKVLEDYHKTFEVYGHQYRHHINKDPKIAGGKVIFSYFNKKMHRVELVVEVDDTKVDDILARLDKGENVATSMACFPSGTKILNSSIKKVNIEDIKIGDKVITHAGEKKQVTEVYERDYNDLLYTINPSGKYRDSIKATKEHPFLIIPIDKFYKYNNGTHVVRNLNLTLDDAIFVPAEKLTGEEYLVVPRLNIKEENSVSLDMAKLLGWYLAEGHTHTSDNGVEFSVNKNDEIVKRIKDVTKDYTVHFDTVENSLEAMKITIYSKELKDACLKYCGKYSHSKFLHEDIFSWSTESKLAFLGAYISGDGYFFNNNIYISSENRELLEQVQWLANSIGLISTIGRNVHKKEHPSYADYDTTEWILRFRKKANAILAPYCDKITSTDNNLLGGSNGPYFYDTFYLVAIESIDTEYFSGPVYNFEVEDHNTYVVEQYAVHNCKVSHDICSICGNKAKTREDYCIHLKHFKNKIHTPSSPIPGAKFYGQKAYAINPDPRFFDISFVTIPADSTSSVLMKVAECIRDKKGSITKEVKTPIDSIEKIDPKLIKQKTLPKEVLDKAAKYDLDSVMCNLVDMNMMPTFSDYAYMSLKRQGYHKEAEYIYGKNIDVDFTKITSDDSVFYKYANSKTDTNICNIFAEYGGYIGTGEPLVVSRILEKEAESQETVNSVPFFLGAGGAYYGYNKLLDKMNNSSVVKTLVEPKLPPAAKSRKAIMLMRNPLLLGAGLVGLGVATNELQRRMVKSSAAGFTPTLNKSIKQFGLSKGLGRFLTATAVLTPLSYLYSSYNRKKMLNGEPVSFTGEQFARHPHLGAATTIAGTYLPGALYKRFKNPKGEFLKASSIPDYISNLYLYDKAEYDKIIENYF